MPEGMMADEPEHVPLIVILPLLDEGAIVAGKKASGYDIATHL